MIAKVHKSNGSIILAVCDKELLGKKFIENDLQLDLSSDFYNGEEVSDEKLRLLIRESYIVNLVGKKSVEFGIKEGIISKKHIIKIRNILHAQALIIKE